MKSKLLQIDHIDLTDTQIKMIQSGWGEDTALNTVVNKITYLSDGLKVKGYIAYPKVINSKIPCIIWCRGGIGNAGAIDEFNAKGIFGQLASWGFLVFSTQYRGNDGGEGRDEFGGDDINDILNLIQLADEFDFADTSQWFIEGWSRGGMMTYLTLTKTDIFKAAIVTGGIANLRCNANESTFMKRLYELTMGKYNSADFNDKCNSRSIVNFPEKMFKTPLLILHGTNDNRVLPHDSLDLANQLLQTNHPFRLIMLENGDHFLKKQRKEVETFRKNWLFKHLSS